MKENIDVERQVTGVEELEKTPIRLLKQEHITQLLRLLLDKTVDGMSLTLGESQKNELEIAFSKVELTFDLYEVEAFKSQSRTSLFAQRLVARVLTGGFLATYGSERYQVFINDLNPLSDPKRKLLHELQHVIDDLLAKKFPEYFRDEREQKNDLKFFLSRGLAGMLAIVLANWSIYSIDVLPFQAQFITAILTTMAIGLKMENLRQYKNDPFEERAKKSEKIVRGRLHRRIRNLMVGR